MSKHYVDRYKYGHENRRKNLFDKLKKGTSEIIETYKRGWLFKTLDGDYFISKRGNLVKREQQPDGK